MCYLRLLPLVTKHYPYTAFCDYVCDYLCHFVRLPSTPDFVHLHTRTLLVATFVPDFTLVPTITGVTLRGFYYRFVVCTAPPRTFLLRLPVLLRCYSDSGLRSTFVTTGALRSGLRIFTCARLRSCLDYATHPTHWLVGSHLYAQFWMTFLHTRVTCHTLDSYLVNSAIFIPFGFMHTFTVCIRSHFWLLCTHAPVPRLVLTLLYNSILRCCCGPVGVIRHLFCARRFTGLDACYVCGCYIALQFVILFTWMRLVTARAFVTLLRLHCV